MCDFTRALGCLWVLVSAVGLGCGSSASDDSSAGAVGGTDGGAATGSGGKATDGAAGAGGTQGTGGSAAAGGASNTGGSPDAGGGTGTGGDGGPPHVVGACDSLAAVGQWENVTPPDQVLPDYRPEGFALDPVHSGTIYLGTDSFNDGNSKGIFKTTDCGKTWVHVSTGRNADQINGGRNWFILIDPFDPLLLYTNSGYFGLGGYKSTNGGVDWDPIWPSADTTLTTATLSFLMGGCALDPYDHTHMLFMFHGQCGAYADQIGCLVESKDSGATWRAIYGQPAFEPSVVGYFLGNSQTWLAPSNGALYRTTDSGGSWTKVADLAAGGHSQGGIYRAKNGAFYLGSPNGILRSPDGISWSLVVGTPQVSLGITGNGTTLWSSGHGYLQSGIRSSPESDGTNWTLVPAPFDTNGDGCPLDYDMDHHLLYASCATTGFWRMVTE